MKKIVDWVKGEIRKLAELPDRPHAVAMGVACGVGIGFTPLYGIKSVLSFLAAFFLRGNRLAAVLTVNLHDILLPFMPLIFVAQYKLGEKMLGREGHGKMAHMDWHQLLSWTTFLDEGLPLLLGSLVFGLVAAPIAYFFTLRALQRVQERRKAKAEILKN